MVLPRGITNNGQTPTIAGHNSLDPAPGAQLGHNSARVFLLVTRAGEVAGSGGTEEDAENAAVDVLRGRWKSGEGSLLKWLGDQVEGLELVVISGGNSEAVAALMARLKVSHERSSRNANRTCRGHGELLPPTTIHVGK